MLPDENGTFLPHHPSVIYLQNMDGRRASSRSPVQVASSTAVDAKGSSSEDRDPVARHMAGTTDVEGQTKACRSSHIPRLSTEGDPYDLSSKFKTKSDLDQIRANSSRKRAAGHGWAPPVAGRKLHALRIQDFYQNQNAAIERMLKSVEEHREEARQEAGADRFKYQVAIYGSLAANVILAALQLYAAITSGSLSLFTTMADAVFDPLSNLALIFSNRAISKVDPRRFPAGKARLETVGNVVFCCLMSSVSFVIIAFAVQQIATNNEAKDYHLPSLIAVCAAFGTKFLLFMYCWMLKDKYSQVHILWQDHRNDMMINGFGILTSVGGAKLDWWIDPGGAILLCVLISYIWLKTALGEFLLLVGIVGPVETQQLITYVCLRHSDAIQGIDTVRVYHSGPRLIAEVDIVMDAASTLLAAHDVAEALQIKLESLPDIERAYVHIDYETTHKPEHGYKKDL